ncbi:MAG TPA: ATPase [Gammaproteobacteria bacterium]|nr:ATPase [Gammaproteobacteria bacterium]
MYLEHFGLARLPFQITPDADFFYPGGDRESILKGLIYSARHSDGIVKVTGEIGSGKSLLCRMLAQQLPTNCTALFLANPNLHGDALVNTLLGDLGIATDTANTSPPIQRLQAQLLTENQRGKQVILLVEEAQATPENTLEELRLLTNLETAQNKLLKMVLFAQPELDITLQQHHLRQFRDRITQNFQLRSMRVDETAEYLQHRLEIAGYRGQPLFPPPLSGCLHTVSAGRLRPLNILADKMLLAAYVDGARVLTEAHLSRALAEHPITATDANPKESAPVLIPNPETAPASVGNFTAPTTAQPRNTAVHSAALNWTEVTKFLIAEAGKAVAVAVNVAQSLLLRGGRQTQRLLNQLFRR